MQSSCCILAISSHCPTNWRNALSYLLSIVGNEKTEIFMENDWLFMLNLNLRMANYSIFFLYGWFRQLCCSGFIFTWLFCSFHQDYFQLKCDNILSKTIKQLTLLLGIYLCHQKSLKFSNWNTFFPMSIKVKIRYQVKQFY